MVVKDMTQTLIRMIGGNQIQLINLNQKRNVLFIRHVKRNRYFDEDFYRSINQANEKILFFLYSIRII